MNCSCGGSYLTFKRGNPVFGSCRYTAERSRERLRMKSSMYFWSEREKIPKEISPFWDVGITISGVSTWWCSICSVVKPYLHGEFATPPRQPGCSGLPMNETSTTTRLIINANALFRFNKFYIKVKHNSNFSSVRFYFRFAGVSMLS